MPCAADLATLDGDLARTAHNAITPALQRKVMKGQNAVACHQEQRGVIPIEADDRVVASHPNDAYRLVDDDGRGDDDPSLADAHGAVARDGVDGPFKRSEVRNVPSGRRWRIRGTNEYVRGRLEV